MLHQVSLADFAGVARASASRKPGAAAPKAAGSAKPTARAKVAEDPVLKAVSRVVDALADGLLVTLTETTSEEDIDTLCAALKEVLA